jgi:hypothetical protein
MALGAVGDTAVILDARLMRLSWHDSTGSYVRSMPVPPTLPFVNPRRGSFRMHPFDDGFLYQATENVHVDRPTQAAILWRAAGQDSVATVRAWDDLDWMDAGRMLTPKQLFGPRAYIAVGSEGLYVHGEGLEYCVDMERIGSLGVTRICRDWSRVPVSPEVQSPDIADVERRGLEGIQLEGFRIAFDQMEVGDLWPAFDRLILDEDDRLWVRRIGPEQAVSHPHYWYYFEDLRPTHFAWDVFNPSGQPVRTVVFPSNFEPRLIEAHRAYGSLELTSGELSIAEATW